LFLRRNVWTCFREKRELDRLQEQSRAAERERRSSSAAWVKSSHPADVHADARKMPTEQQQQQDQRRERERALIVDKATAGCVADAVNQHFQESLKHVEQKVSRVDSYIRSYSIVTLTFVFIAGFDRHNVRYTAVGRRTIAFRAGNVATRVKACPHCRRKNASVAVVSPLSVTVALFCDSVDRALRLMMHRTVGPLYSWPWR